MTFDDLFKTPVRQSEANPTLRKVRKVEESLLITREKVCAYDRDTHSRIGINPGIQPSAPSALVPIDIPFADGMRYREAGATEIRTRLDLFVSDPAGPWVRRYGVLVATRDRDRPLP